MQASHGDLGVDGHLIGDGLWQRVLEGLRAEPHMHTHDLDRLRRFVGACFVVLRRNCTWAELADVVPSAEAAKKRFRRWAKKGVWDRLFQHSQPNAQPDALHIDSTSIKCHRTATRARNGGEEAIGRSRGGLTTKVHHALRFAAHNRRDSLGFIRRLLTSPGQHADCRHAVALTADLQPVAVVGDKGYDSDKLRDHWRAQGISTCVPPKRNRLVQHAYNAALYRTRHIVENSFNRLKDHRRLSLRLDKTDASFRAFACLAATLMNQQTLLKLCP